MRTILQLIFIIGLAMSASAGTNAPSPGTLVLARLKIESSYLQNIEKPATKVPDSVQIWIGSTNSWRIRTFAIDHDIHVHSLGNLAADKDGAESFAKAHLEKVYGDVLDRIVVVRVSEGDNTDSVNGEFTRRSLGGVFEQAKAGFGFWNPDKAEYRTRSRPK